MKFKVGDVIKKIDDPFQDSIYHGLKIGDVGVIMELTYYSNVFRVRFFNGVILAQADNEIELVKNKEEIC